MASVVCLSVTGESYNYRFGSGPRLNTLSPGLSPSPAFAVTNPAAGIPQPGTGAVVSLPATHGSGDALLLAALATRHAEQSCLLMVITASALDAARLEEETRWFAPTLRIKSLPDWETLPYDAFSPHQDLVSERL
jgi:transcription-repair coupling factor (superfamily II helicase)